MYKQDSFASTPYIPYVLESVVKCNQNFFEIIKKYNDIALEFFHNSKISYSNKSSSLFIDLNEKQPDLAFSAYLYYDGLIIRFLKIIIDYCFLFPIRELNENKGFIYRNGIVYEKLQELAIDKDKIILFCHNPFSVENVVPLYNKCGTNKPIFVVDDIGTPFHFCKQLDSLSILDVPSCILEQKYTLVGVNHYAPLTAKEAYCVLYAEENNPFDINAIKVLRWLPQKKSSTKMYSWGDYFFELGYISKNENEELHDYMVKNHSRILFGKKFEDKITLLGGVKIFFDNEFYYPKCLSQIPIL